MHNTNSSIYDILVLTETRLDPDVSTSELGFINYNVFRCDRSADNSIKMKGGGVLIAVRSDLKACQFHPPNANIEAVFVTVTLNALPKILVCGVYIPPGQHIARYQTFSDSLECFTASYDVGTNLICAGDFNLNSAVSSLESQSLIYDTANALNLCQCSTIVNSRGTALDLIFSDLPCSVDVASDLLAYEDAHHPALDIDVPLPGKLDVSNLTAFVYNFNKCNMDALGADISLIVGEVLLRSDCGVDDRFNYFVHELSEAVKKHTPLKRVGPSPFPRWFSRDLKSAVVLKKILHKKYKQTGLHSDYMAFSRTRAMCKTKSMECYRSYITHINDVIPSNIKIFWSHINSLRKSRDVPSKIRLGMDESSDPTAMANIFARHFSSVYSHPPVAPPQYPDRLSNVYITSIQVSSCEVKDKLRCLDVTKGVGPDQIPASVLRNFNESLSVVLCELFNQSLSQGVFPLVLKNSYITPIYKNGDVSVAQNYRPITTQSHIAKIFESLVLDRLRPLLGSVIVDQQHGFIRGRSTVTNLLTFENYVFTSFDQRSQVDAAYLDFSKAFDKVSHDHLVAKLRACGIFGRYLPWIDSYLRDRTSTIKLMYSTSAPIKVESGVPQGSLLGPCLFNLFINDIGEGIETEYLLFADDIKLFDTITQQCDGAPLQRSLNNIEAWCADNCMSLNLTKCNIMSFTRCNNVAIVDYRLGGVSLARCQLVKDLGVYFNPALTPEHHVDEICKRSLRLMGLVARASRSGFSVKAITILYKTLIRPLLEYASVVWKPCQDIFVTRLQRVQRRFVRIVAVAKGYTFLDAPVEELELELELSSLAGRRDTADLTFLFNLVNGRVSCPVLLEKICFRIPGVTRSNELFHRPHYRTNYLGNSSVIRIQRLGNAVPPDVDFFSDSLDVFKRKISS